LSKYLKLILFIIFLWFLIVFLYTLLINNKVDLFALTIAIVGVGLSIYDYMFLQNNRPDKESKKESIDLDNE